MHSMEKVFYINPGLAECVVEVVVRCAGVERGKRASDTSRVRVYYHGDDLYAELPSLESGVVSSACVAIVWQQRSREPMDAWTGNDVVVHYQKVSPMW
jgi:hypothetical protein